MLLIYSLFSLQIRTHCKCDVRTFRASSFPDHVADISNFAYRPILIQVSWRERERERERESSGPDKKEYQG